MPDGRHGDMAAEVAAMVRMRKDAGITSDSRVDILVAESDVYVARVRGRHADVSFADVRRAALGALASVEQSEDDAFWSAAADAADAAAAAAQDDSSSDDELEIVY